MPPLCRLVSKDSDFIFLPALLLMKVNQMLLNFLIATNINSSRARVKLSDDYFDSRNVSSLDPCCVNKLRIDSYVSRIKELLLTLLYPMLAYILNSKIE